MATPLHEFRPTTRFSDRADDYVKFRPTYPAAALDAVLMGLGPPGMLVVADVGAGTGISSRLLAERGCRVIAIEPNGAMRAAAEPHPGVEWRDGSAEATGLKEASVDLVVCAQAFHWFRPGEALAEFARVLRPGGRLALLWNLRDETDGLTGEYGAAVRRAATDGAVDKDLQADWLFRTPPFGGARLARLTGEAQVLTEQGLIGRALSSSYVPREGPGLERLIAELRTMHGRHAGPDGQVRFPYVTEVYLADRAG
jgi:SAM-dependent methyltransferase